MLLMGKKIFTFLHSKYMFIEVQQRILEQMAVAQERIDCSMQNPKGWRNRRDGLSCFRLLCGLGCINGLL